MDFQLSTSHFKYQFLASKRKSKKIMLVLHGRGDSLKPFKNFDKELGVSEMNYLLLNAPRKYLKGFSWFGEPPFERTGVLRIRSMIFDVINDLEKQGYSARNIFLFGFSQGCLVSTDVALNYPKQLGGIIGVSGYFHFFPRWRQGLTQDSRKTPWIMTHGYRDDILPYQETKFGVEKLKDSGLDVEFISLNKKHDMVDEEFPIIKRWVKTHL